VVHPDLHAANVLVTAEGRLVLIDFHSARIVRRGRASGSSGSPPALAARFRDLAALAGTFLVLGTRTDRLRFFSAYCGSGRAYCGSGRAYCGSGAAGNRRLPGLDDPKKAARDLETAAWKRLRRFFEKRDLRPLREGRGFKRLQLHDWMGMSEDSERAVRLARFLGPHPEETLEREGRILKRDSASAVYGVALDGDRFVIKIHEPRGAGAPIKHLAGGTRGRAAWLNAHRLRARALPTARPVLFLEEPVHSPGGRSLVVFEEEAGLPTLDRFVEEAVRGGVEGRASLEKILHRLARTLARMHNFFMSNRDLKAQNILVAGDGEPVLVDLDGVDAAGEVDLYTMARDLMRLNASFPEKGPISIRDRLRFLAIYARARGLDRKTRKALRLEVMHLTLAKWRTWRAAARPRPRGMIPSF
jgi:Ser/Thr protein kinase RdoA (MazF antagonist)